MSEHKYLKTRINGLWIGSWGDRTNVKVSIELKDDGLTGYYLLDSSKYYFSGKISPQLTHIDITFDYPMSQNSGGVYDFDKDTLKLFCEDKVYIFNRYSN